MSAGTVTSSFRSPAIRSSVCRLAKIGSFRSFSLHSPSGSKARLFKSGATILDTFGLAKGGKEYRRIVAGFERIFGATIFFGTEEQANFSRVVHRAQFNFIQQARIWYDGGSGEDNLITLSPEFFEEAKAHPIPADLDVAKLLVL